MGALTDAVNQNEEAFRQLGNGIAVAATEAVKFGAFIIEATRQAGDLAAVAGMMFTDGTSWDEAWNAIKRVEEARKADAEAAKKQGAETSKTNKTFNEAALTATKAAAAMTDLERARKGESMASARNDVMGEIARLKALAAGRKHAADQIDRELRIQRDKAEIMRQTGASEEQALKLATQKANLEDRIAGKRSKIGGVTNKKYMEDRVSGPLSNNGPLTANGGIDGFNRNQQKTETDRNDPALPGYKRGGYVPRFFDPLSRRGATPVGGGATRTTFDVSGQVNAAAAAPAQAARDAAASATQTADPALGKLDAIHKELTRIRTS